MEVSAAEALNHPTWRMGRKITNRLCDADEQGLEVIEARWLFGVRTDQIDVVIHPQSIVHSMSSSSTARSIAQLGVTDMRCRQYAFSYPERWSPPPTLSLISRARTSRVRRARTRRVSVLRLRMRARGRAKPSRRPQRGK